jgi:hypothetical protein
MLSVLWRGDGREGIKMIISSVCAIIGLVVGYIIGYEDGMMEG